MADLGELMSNGRSGCTARGGGGQNRFLKLTFEMRQAKFDKHFSFLIKINPSQTHAYISVPKLINWMFKSSF